MGSAQPGRAVHATGWPSGDRGILEPLTRSDGHGLDIGLVQKAWSHKKWKRGAGRRANGPNDQNKAYPQGGPL